MTGFDLRGGGMQNALQRMTVYCSEEAHSSIQKAVELLCFGRDAAPRPRERGHAYRPRGPDGGDQGRPRGRASTGLRRRGRGDDQHGRRGRPRRPLGYLCLGAVLVPHRLDAVPGPSRRGHSGARAGPTGLAGHGKLPLHPARPGRGSAGISSSCDGRSRPRAGRLLGMRGIEGRIPSFPSFHPITRARPRGRLSPCPPVRTSPWKGRPPALPSKDRGVDAFFSPSRVSRTGQPGRQEQSEKSEKKP